jgi:hypothetical protein
MLLSIFPIWCAAVEAGNIQLAGNEVTAYLVMLEVTSADR